MEYTQTIKKFAPNASPEAIEELLANTIGPRMAENMRAEVLKTCFRCIDLTSLGSTDTPKQIEALTTKVVNLPNHFPAWAQVASICVYPALVEDVGVAMGNSSVGITSVAGGFPSSQTFLEVKMLEMAMAVESGADEIDIVLSLGELLAGNYDLVGTEIETLRAELDETTTLKVILESGLLAQGELIHRASLIAMSAGADFIKTSTGKNGTGATPEAAVVMCQAIRAYHAATGRKVGFKAAGGITRAEDAALYYTIVEQILGPEWLTPQLFRLGASSLANSLLSAIEGREVVYF